MRRLALGLLVLGLSACGSNEGQVSPKRGAEVKAKAKSNFATHWDALAMRLPSFEDSVHVASAFTAKTEIGVVRIIDRMQLPFIPANSMPAEFVKDLPMVALVVSGTGRVALLSGESWELNPGDALLLPPSARGFFTCTDTRRIGFVGGLRLLTLRVLGDADFEPQHLEYETQWRGVKPNKEVQIGSLGAAGSLHAYLCEDELIEGSVQPGLLTPRFQREREKIMFFVQGEGRFGLANSGNQARPGSLFCIAPGSAHYFENMDDVSSQALVLYTPGWTAASDDTEPYRTE